MSDVVKGVYKDKVNTEAYNLVPEGMNLLPLFSGLLFKILFTLNAYLDHIVFIHGVFSIL